MGELRLSEDLLPAEEESLRIPGAHEIRADIDSYLPVVAILRLLRNWKDAKAVNRVCTGKEGTPAQDSTLSAVAVGAWSLSSSSKKTELKKEKIKIPTPLFRSWLSEEVTAPALRAGILPLLFKAENWAGVVQCVDLERKWEKAWGFQYSRLNQEYIYTREREHAKGRPEYVVDEGVSAGAAWSKGPETHHEREEAFDKARERRKQSAIERHKRGLQALR